MFSLLISVLISVLFVIRILIEYPRLKCVFIIIFCINNSYLSTPRSCHLLFSLFSSLLSIKFHAGGQQPAGEAPEPAEQAGVGRAEELAGEAGQRQGAAVPVRGRRKGVQEQVLEKN